MIYIFRCAFSSTKSESLKKLQEAHLGRTLTAIPEAEDKYIYWYWSQFQGNVCTSLGSYSRCLWDMPTKNILPIPFVCRKFSARLVCQCLSLVLYIRTTLFARWSIFSKKLRLSFFRLFIIKILDIFWHADFITLCFRRLDNLACNLVHHPTPSPGGLNIFSNREKIRFL